jgi:hypothetical protein
MTDDELESDEYVGARVIARRMGWWIADWDDEEDGSPQPVSAACASVLRGMASAIARRDERNPAFVGLPYAAYLRTAYWRGRRVRALLRSGGQCQVCYADDRPLEVHHLTYQRLGWETDADLIVLCGPCHAREHNQGTRL